MARKATTTAPSRRERTRQEWPLLPILLLAGLLVFFAAVIGAALQCLHRRRAAVSNFIQRCCVSPTSSDVQPRTIPLWSFSCSIDSHPHGPRVTGRA
jgi:hypothetical protein